MISAIKILPQKKKIRQKPICDKVKLLKFHLDKITQNSPWVKFPWLKTRNQAIKWIYNKTAYSQIQTNYPSSERFYMNAACDSHDILQVCLS